MLFIPRPCFSFAKHAALFATFVARPTLMCSSTLRCVFPGRFEKGFSVSRCWCTFTLRLLGRVTVLGFREVNAGENDEEQALF